MRRIALLLCVALAAHAKTKKEPEPSPLDRYVQESMQAAAAPSAAAPGSAWRPGAPLADMARDPKASQVNDLVTILVVERASAVAKGSTKSARSSSVKASVAALAGPKSATSALANLAGLSGDSQLSGEGATTRETVLNTTLSARVTHVLPNGYLVVEGVKDLQVNSEHQTIIVRGVARPQDMTPGNVVRSDRLAQLEVRVNGKGVVGDAIRRPFFLYRLLMGVLPI